MVGRKMVPEMSVIGIMGSNSAWVIDMCQSVSMILWHVDPLLGNDSEINN
jgi:hypothetical protein